MAHDFASRLNDQVIAIDTVIHETNDAEVPLLLSDTTTAIMSDALTATGGSIVCVFDITLPVVTEAGSAIETAAPVAV